LKSLIKEDAEVAEDYAVKLSDFLRYSVDSHKTELVRLDQELTFVNNYIELQKVRFEDAFEFSYSIPPAVLSHKIPVFALQTLIENAFKHNYFTSKKRLNITITYQNGQLMVANNKVSIRLAERTQTGLSNLNKRYELITGKGIQVVETDDAFCVSINLIAI
jgi:LytS/YehU family sensor histidine kinase